MASWSDGADVRFEIAPRFLNLDYTLDCGQAFRWKRNRDGWWCGVVRGQAVRLRRDGGEVIGQLYPGRDDAEPFLASYLRLDVELEALYREFAAADEWIAAAVESYAGLRVLNQEPQETLLSYVCSTANSVPRISKAVAEMSRRWGRLIGTLDGEEFHAFPTAEALAAAPEDALWRDCGLGWRGTNLKRLAGDLTPMADGWPEQLRGLPYREAKARLMELRGIGAKIADCVCLFSLEKDEAVPVDTHIWALAKEIFSCEISNKTLTPATYETVAKLYLERYGRFAGWAQEYLYLHRRASQGRVSSVHSE
ncbi:MAG TPA: DNA glycosylase [Chloroflexota bacterium]|nr:DNA glycosylase [Chloroflexota bacterium]